MLGPGSGSGLGLGLGQGLALGLALALGLDFEVRLYLVVSFLIGEVQCCVFAQVSHVHVRPRLDQQLHDC